jgi:leucyl-tRNA synthetase
MGVTYLAVAPQHPLAQEAATSNTEVAKFIEKQTKNKVAEAELAKLKKRRSEHRTDGFSSYY